MLDILSKANLDQKIIDYVNYTMNTFVRMPYSNNWRVRTQEGRRIKSGRELTINLSYILQVN